MMLPKKVNHGRMKPKRNVMPTSEETRYHDHIRSLRCLVPLCGQPASLHHVISDGHKRITKDHWLVTPLCYEHHQGDTGYHGMGSHALFVQEYGVNLYDEAVRLKEEYLIS